MAVFLTGSTTFRDTSTMSVTETDAELTALRNRILELQASLSRAYGCSLDERGGR